METYKRLHSIALVSAALILFLIIISSTASAATEQSASPAGTYAYITNDGDGTVSIIDTATNTITATVNVGYGPEGVAVNPGGTKVYVTNYWDSIVSVIDTSTNKVTAKINVGYYSWEVAVSPNGKKVYVTNTDRSIVSVIDAATNTVTATVPVPIETHPTGVAIGILESQNSPMPPVGNFTANVTEGYAPLTVQFTDLSQNATGWKWNFGDGNNSTEQNPVHTYSKVGEYTVTLIVKNEKGSNTTSKSKYINVANLLKPPTTAFSASPTSGKVPLTVAFTDKSTGTPIKWKWSFGDGSKSFLQNPVHKYSKAGKYTVSLTISNAAGSNTVTKTDYIKVIVKPVANFSASPTSGKTPLNVAFTDTSTGSPTSWFWNFGDGSKSYLQNPTHKYSKEGIYSVSLTVKNAAGRNTITKTDYIKVVTKPVAAFSASSTSGKIPLKVTFTDTSTGTPTKWKWSFGDGSKSFLQNPTHKYSKAGKYTVSLTVTNAAGINTRTVSNYITVKK